MLLAIVARQLADRGSNDPSTTLALIGLLAVSGVSYLTLLALIPGIERDPGLLLACLALGLTMRLVQFGAPTIYEADYYRYLWDGAVTAAGHDPYGHPPAAAAAQRITRSVWQSLDAQAAPPKLWPLADLADASGGVVERVPYPYLTTIYPPVAQAAFALAHRLSAFSLNGWRLVVLAAELLSVMLLLRLLAIAGQAPLWVLLYWWNPLVMTQFANAAHMDALLCPVLLATMWAAVRSRVFTASGLLAIAAGIKLWPLILLPLLGAIERTSRRRVAAVALCLGLSTLLLWPMLRHLTDPGAGLVAYSMDWQRNAFAFPLIARMLAAVVPAGWNAAGIARIGVGLIVGGMAMALAARRVRAEPGPRDPLVHAREWTMVIAALFLLSPTGYPWYFAWMLPLLCIWRQPALLALTVLLPLYYTRFPIEADGERRWLQTWMATLEFLPVWLGLGYGAWHKRRV